jgi:hypothetical protein
VLECGVRITEVMDELATRLRTIPVLRVHEWPVGSAIPPAAIVAYPEEYRYDETYANGMESMTIHVVVLIGKPTDRSTRTALSDYLTVGGVSSVKLALESGVTTVFDDIRVADAVTDVYELAATQYLAAIFTCEITGQGG